MRILPIFLALVSWFVSFLVVESYEETTWQCLVSVILADIVFMFLFMSGKIHYVTSRWACTVLFISVVPTVIFMILMYSYQSFIIDRNFIVLAAFENYYNLFGLIMSMLVLLVSAVPPRIASALDGLYWPHFADGIRYSCDMDRVHHAKDSSCQE